MLTFLPRLILACKDKPRSQGLCEVDSSDLISIFSIFHVIMSPWRKKLAKRVYPLNVDVMARP
jgi:hypothetical protein